MKFAKLIHGDPAANPETLPRLLRLGVAGCFIGHGAFGIITKAAWLPYFAVGGISEPHAWQLMPWVGAMDIGMGLLALFRPCRALFLWAVIWATWTALLRPLAGEPFWEALERAGNYGVPVALLAVAGLRGRWFERLHNLRITGDATQHYRLAVVLRATVFTLLVGHAGLGLFSHKTGLSQHYAALGVGDSTALVAGVGGFEFLLAALVLLVRRWEVLLAICVWKVASESLFLVAGAPIWELIERFGSYTAPLALALLVRQAQTEQSSSGSPVPA